MENSDEPVVQAEPVVEQPRALPPPNRWLALALSLLCAGAWGSGQYYLGFRRRAFAWLFGLAAGTLLWLGLLISPLAHGSTLKVLLAGFMGFVAFAFVGPFADVIWLPRRRFERVAWRNLVLFLVLATVTSTCVRLGARSMLLEAFKLPSGSMLPTLRPGDHIMVDHFHYGPQLPFSSVRLGGKPAITRGDVIVFEYPDPDASNPRSDFVKRVVALPGDTLEVDAGHLVLNGVPAPSCHVGTYTARLPEPVSGELWVEFLGDVSYLIWLDQRAFAPRHTGPYRVLPGEVWVLGDNRENSSDSRTWNGGRGAGVPFDLVKGRARFVWLAFEGETVNFSRSGVELTDTPKLPADASPSLASKLEACLARRPVAAKR
ncbi:MAG: signal peptidase I [Myxococcota bacterium]